jgi:nucleoid DNA-binding protein
METISKQQIVAFLTEHHSLSKAEAGRILESLETFIEAKLQEGDSVRLPHLGTFKVAQRSARMGRNPLTGESLEIPAKRTLQFKVGKGIREALNA